MTLQIKLTPEIEARLREQAAAAGKDIAEVAREVLREGLCLDAEPDDGPTKLSREQRLATWRDFVADAKPLGYIVDDSRESIYEGRGE